MSELNDPNVEGQGKDMEITQKDVRNCYALSLDKRLEEIVSVTTSIEELLGLTSDIDFRHERVEHFRQQAILSGVDPHLDPAFTVDVERYCRFLREKKEILEHIFECSEEFGITMKSELDSMNQQYASNPQECTSFVNDYLQSKDSTSRSSRSSIADKRQRKNRLPSAAIKILWDFVHTHKNNPYPTTQQKEMLAKQTKLTMTQIRNWFTNTRKRKLSQSPDSDEDFSLDSDNGDSYVPSEDGHYGRHHRANNKRKVAFSAPSDSEYAGYNADYYSTNQEEYQNPGNRDNSTYSTFPDETRNSSGTWINYPSDTKRPFSNNNGLVGIVGRNSEKTLQSVPSKGDSEFNVNDFDLFPSRGLQPSISFISPLPDDDMRLNIPSPVPPSSEFFLNNEMPSRVKTSPSTGTDRMCEESVKESNSLRGESSFVFRT